MNNQNLSNDTGLTFKKGFEKKRKFTKKIQKPTLGGLQKELAIMKKTVAKKFKEDEPPLKYTYAEFVVSPENTWTNMEFLWPIQGNTVNERLQSIIQVKSMQFNFIVKASESDGFDNVRVVFIQYVDANLSGTPPDINIVFIDAGTSFPYIGQYNSLNRSRYRVLFDKTYCVNYNGIASIADSFTCTSRDLTTNHGKMIYISDTDTNGNVPGLEGGYVIGYCCSDSSASPNPSIEYTTRMNFTDT